MSNKTKVLIISHNPITTYNGMGKTLQALFRNFSCDELCQLYCYPTIPDIKACLSYYRITDINVLKSWVSLFRVKGRIIEDEEISPENGLFECAKNESHYHTRKHYKRYLRDVMWKCSNWYNKDLRAWIEEQNPSCIFLAPGDAEFLYDIALKIADDYNLPIVTYICDDIFFMKSPKEFFAQIRYKRLKRKIEKVIARTSHIIAISDSLANEYKSKFDVPCTVIMTGTDKFKKSIPFKGGIDTLTYMGNICFNRYKSLLDIGRCLASINEKSGTDYCILIYTNEKDPAILKQLKSCKAIKLCGFVTGEEYEKTFMSAQAHLHVEAFDDENIELVKHSISTKIPDILASGVPMIAYGPLNVASMQVLHDNDCALYIKSENELNEKIEELLKNREKQEQTVHNAMRFARNSCDVNNNSNYLRRIIQTAEQVSCAGS